MKSPSPAQSITTDPRSNPELEVRLAELARLDTDSNARARANLAAERNALEAIIKSPLDAIDRVRLARNPARPQTLDYVAALINEFFEIHGDRRFADDGAIVAGLGYFGRIPV